MNSPARSTPTWRTMPVVRSEKPSRSTQLVSRLRGLLAVGAAATLWLLHRPVMALVALSLGVILTLIAELSPRGLRLLNLLFERVGSVVGFVVTQVVLGSVYALVFTPVALVLRSMGRDLLASRYDKALASYWEPVARSPKRRLFSRQFSFEPVQRASGGMFLPFRLILIGVGALAVDVLITNFNLGDVLPSGPKSAPELPAAAVARGLDWWADYKSEESQMHGVFVPFIVWRRRDFAGRYVHVDGGIRKTANTPHENEARVLNVAMFGGSTMWGIGARDEHTIPSEFSRAAERAGIPVRVTNYGDLSYVARQEVIYLGQLLASGTPIDAVIMYDGWNEILIQSTEGLGTTPAHNGARDLALAREEPAKYVVAAAAEHSTIFGLLNERVNPPRTDQATPEQWAAAAAKIYNESIDLGRRISLGYGAPFMAFWQPTLYTKKVQDPGERHDYEDWIQRRGRKRLKLDPAFMAATKLIDSRVVPLTDLFDKVDGPIFVDPVHVAEPGNALIADAMFRAYEPALREALAKKSTSTSRSAP